MTTTNAGRLRDGLGEVLQWAPWAPRTWLATVHLLSGAPIGLLAVTAIATLLSATLTVAVSVVAIPLMLGALFACLRWLTTLQRSRFAALLGVDIPPVPREFEGGRLRRMLAETRDRDTWRQVGFHLLSFVIETCGGAALALLWGTALVLVSVFAFGAGLPALGVEVLPVRSAHGWDLYREETLTVITVLGAMSLFAAPWVARGLSELDVAAARALLGPNREEELSHRVEELTESRAAVLDAADAERRRIERDLHDGAQQRLVSLAMNLGMTRALYPDLPEPVRDAIVQHHEEAKLALAELRDFVRGLHPAVLTELGLDAALSGIAVRSPVPVRLRVDLPVRPPPATEAVAYFVVSEALANVAKHARADRAEVAVTQEDGLLRVAVTDDGVGGATTGGGSGLPGLVRRVASVDGTLHIDSPPGGPTTITVEIPCASS